MSGPVMVINSGSSSLKYQLVVPDTGEVLASGLLERIGESTGLLKHQNADGEEFKSEHPIPDHRQGLAMVRELFAEHGPNLREIGVVAVGHRVVHGGPDFSDPVVIDDAVLAEITDLIPLAPLHNPAAVAGIEAARTTFDVPHVAVFDTGFFAKLPEASKTYAIPADLARDHKIRRYGFHGTSHAYVSRTAAETLGRPVADTNVIVFHLGNGASVSAVRGGHAIETSMGLTPLEGLVMGTRSGDVDPGLHAYLHNELGLSIGDIDALLNKQSGLKGLCGENDFRAIEERIAGGDQAAKLAFDIYIHRLKHYLGAYAFQLGRLDILAFTAGIGENSDTVRAAAVQGLEHFGLHLSTERNTPRSKEPRVVSTDDSPVTIMVVPTNEELAIAREAQRLAA